MKRNANELAVLICAALLVCFFGNLVAQPSGCPSGIIHYWKLNETTGGPFVDFYAGNDATCTACPTAVTGQVNGAQEFDRTTTRVSVADDGSFDWSQDDSFTFEFWMNQSAGCTGTATDDNQVILGRIGAGWWFGINCGSLDPEGHIRAQFSPGTGTMFSTAPVTDGDWHHIVFVFDADADEMRLFIDGALDNSKSWVGRDLSGTDDLTVGWFSSAYGYAGLLDELALYSVALDQATIVDHYNSGVGKEYCVTNQCPVVSDIPDQSVLVGTSFTTINLDDYVEDSDDADADISWTASGNINFDVDITDRVATITPLDPFWTGSETITFTASDPSSCTDFDDAVFTITNDCPVISDIGDQSVVAGNNFATINLDDYVTDADHTDDLLTWSTSGESNLIVDIVDRVATITLVDSDWIGSETITFTVTDPGDCSASDDVTFTVLSDDCPPSMVHYWMLDEGSGSGLFIDIVSDLDATCTDCPTPVSGIVNGAREFDRDNNRVNIADDGSFDWAANESWTIECWINKSDGCTGTAQADNEVIIGRATAGWWLGINCESGESKVRFYKGGAFDLRSDDIVTDGVWHHIVAAYDANSDKVYLYIDGVKNDSSSWAGADLSNNTDITVGWFSPSPYYGFLGIIDELAVYNAALDEATVQGHYANGLLGQGYCTISETPPQIVSTPVTSAIAGQAYSYDVNAIGNPTPTYTLMTSPAGMTIDNMTGIISWMPNTTGDFDVTVQASNTQGTDMQSFTISVASPMTCENILHYWKLGENSEPYVDIINGLDAYVDGVAPTAVSGIVGSAQLFGGTDVGLSIADDGSCDWTTTDDFSFEFWMKRDTLTQPGLDQNEVILGRIGATMWIGIHTGNPLVAGATLNGVFVASHGNYVWSSMPITDGQWHHIAGVHDGATNTLTLYIDGVEDLSGDIGNFAGTDPYTIGWFNTGGRYPYKGILDELALYDALISPADIVTHFNNGLLGKGYCIQYACGDATGDGGITVADVTFLVLYVFGGGAAPSPLAAGDANCDGTMNVGDAVYVLNYIFKGGPAPCCP